MAAATAAKPVKHVHKLGRLGIDFTYVPAGSFLMGGDALAKPAHRVSLSGFWMSTFPVTNREFDSWAKGRQRPKECLADDDPACGISRTAALEFAAFIAKTAHDSCSLPSEAQWEYAARGGLEGKDYPWGNEDWEGRAQLGQLRTAPVGSFAPNGYGLYDMAGNVFQHVQETWYDYRTVLNKAHDPHGPTNGPIGVMRGGGFDIWESEVWLRNPYAIPESHDGVRVVINSGKGP